MEYINIITYGDYSDYSIHSVWVDKAEAQSKCDKLNLTARYITYIVEEYPLNCLPLHDQFCVEATYSTKRYGYEVNTSNIKFKEGTTKASNLTHSTTTVTPYGVIKVVAGSKEKAERIIFDKVAEMHAKSEKIT